VQTVNLTFPDGSKNSVSLNWSVGSETARMFLSSARDISSNQTSEIKSTYYSIIASLHTTPNSDIYDAQASNQIDDSSLILDSDIWIARVKYRPIFEWYITTYTWDGTFIRGCNSNDQAIKNGARAIELDTVALDLLSNYILAVIWKLYDNRDILFS
jgi:hypothetical protein